MHPAAGRGAAEAPRRDVPVVRAVAGGAVPAEVAAAVVATTPTFVCVIGAGGALTHLNPALEAATGWTTAEVAGRPFWEVLPVAHEVAPARDCVERALAHGEADAQEGDWVDRHGGTRRMSMQLSVLRDEHDAVTALVSVGFDVTAQRQAEARLRARARTDELTGLANRSGLAKALRGVLEDPTSPGCGVLFAAPFTTVHGLVRLGISVGTALGGPGATPQSLLAAADRHMYGVKSRRRARRTRRAPVG